MDGRYRQGLTGGSGEYLRRIEVWRKETGTFTRIDTFGNQGLPIVSGQVTATLRNRVTRTVSLTVPLWHPDWHGGQSMIPMKSGDLLDPLGSELRIWAGWRFGALQTGMWPVFRGPITDVSAQMGSPDLQVSASDRAEPVVACRFLSPRTAPAGSLVTAAASDMITDVLGGGNIGDYDETYVTVPTATWDSDRAGALDSIMTLADCFWYADATGMFTFRRVPWSVASFGTPLVTYSSGAGLLGAEVKLSRSDVYNAVVVPTSNTDGSNPAVGSSIDLDPVSRTCSTGPMGMRVLEESAQNVSSSGQAATLARRKRIRTLATLEDWTARIVADPTLELGDVCAIHEFGATRSLCLAGFTLPLAGKPEMATTWRLAGGDVS